MITFDSLVHNIKAPYTSQDLEKLRVAYEIAEYLHKDVVRESGEPYIIHPLSVANIMALDWYVDIDTLCAALLHDVIEDTDFTFQDIAKNLNETIAILVDGVTKLKGLKLSDKQSVKYANERKLVEGFLTDPRIYLLKESDRLHNMRTIQFKKKRYKQIENALETLDLYLAGANRMGTCKMLNELANLSLKCLIPNEYDRILMLREELEEKRNLELQHMMMDIQSYLSSLGISVNMFYRVKNTYQLYQRLRRGKTIPEIHDLYAIKILTNNVKECYQIFDILRDKFTCIPEDTRDFIVNPKENMYQSLHLGILNDNKTMVQVQIKTERQHEIAEHGYAAFWKFYGADAPQKMKEEIRKTKFFQKIQNISEEFQDNKDFVEQIRFEVFYNNYVHVYTPKNDMFTFPKGSTPIDFAFSIHSDLLKHFFGARVNGKFVPINYELQNGDRIQILTNDNLLGPNEEWINAAKSVGAARYIRKYGRSNSEQ